MNTLSKSLAGGDATLYLLHGAEAFVSREAMAWLREAVLHGIAEDFNYDRFDAREGLDIIRIVQAARTLPMMSARRLVRIAHAEQLFSQSKDALAPLLKYVADPDPSTCLVFHASSTVKKNGVLYKRLKKAACIFEAATPRERELVGWILTRSNERGCRISHDAAAMLKDAVGRDLSTLDGALERLSLYVGGRQIERADVEAVVPHSRSRSVWDLVEALADRDTARVLAQAHELLEQGEHPLRLLPLVTRQFRMLMVGRGAMAGGATPAEAAREAGVPPFKASAFARQLNNYSGRELIAALERLAKADRALKGSGLPDDLILESALLDLCVGVQ